MKSCVRIFSLLLLIIVPSVVSAESLDDYYLSSLEPTYYGTHILSGVQTGHSVQAVRCQTGIRHSARLDWDKLQPSTRKTLSKTLSRPVLSEERVCAPVNGHFNIHYATSGPDAPDLTDANQNGVPDWVETVAGVFEYVYDIEVTKMGYAPPPVSKYDVYLKDLVAERAYGFTTDDGIPAFPLTSAPSYIEIDKAFTNPLFTVNGRYSSKQLLGITAAHEFHHAIQFGYNYYFDFWYAEVTSTWMEDEVYDSVNQLYSYLPNYLSLASTLAIDAPLGDNSEYGRWIFNRYLTEIQGSRTAIRAIWQELGKTPAPADRKDIPMLPLIQNVLQDNLGNNFFGFSKKILLRDWSTHLGDILFVPDVSPAGTFSAHGTVQAPINVLPTPYTFTFYKYTPSSVDNQDLIISFPGLSPDHAVSAFKKDGLGFHEYAFDSSSQSITVSAFSSDAVVYLVVCNNGGDMRNPVAISFPADLLNVKTDGTGLDANQLVIPPQAALPTAIGSAKTSGGGGCFIATAAYGSYMHPKVAELRTFRDRYLLTNVPGRLFVALYYRLSPPVARVIGEHEWMRGGVRLLLVPVVLAVEHPGGALLVLMLSGGWAVFGLARRGRSIRPAAVSSAGAH